MTNADRNLAFHLEIDRLLADKGTAKRAADFRGLLCLAENGCTAIHEAEVWTVKGRPVLLVKLKYRPMFLTGSGVPRPGWMVAFPKRARMVAPSTMWRLKCELYGPRESRKARAYWIRTWDVVSLFNWDKNTRQRIVDRLESKDTRWQIAVRGKFEPPLQPERRSRRPKGKLSQSGDAVEVEA